jgi:hypothetical protein
VRKTRAANGSELLTTAPFVDRDEYLEGMDWKRKVDAEHGTVLVETYSWERERGSCWIAPSFVISRMAATRLMISPRRQHRST